MVRVTSSEVRGRSHYTHEYTDLPKWMLYYEQCDTILRLSPRPKRVLVVGKGRGVVEAYLREEGLSVTTLDVDESLGSDLVGDVRSLDPLLVGVYDLVVVCHVLEHLPFSDLEKSLESLGRVSPRALVSIPHINVFLEAWFHFHTWKKMSGAGWQIKKEWRPVVNAWSHYFLLVR